MNKNYTEYLDYLEILIIGELYKIYEQSGFSNYNDFHNYYHFKVKLNNTSFYVEYNKLIKQIKYGLGEIGVTDKEIIMILEIIFKNKL